jgi:hypothetical protein
VKNTSRLKLLAAILTLTLSGTLLSCGSQEPHAGSCFVNVNGAEPEQEFHPLSTNDAAGLRLASVLQSGLVYIDETGQPQLDLAESIKQLSPTSYEVTLPEDLQFSDGSPITAKTFVDSWNYAVAQDEFWAPQLNNIVGFGEYGAGLSGLKVVSDTVFTIELREPRLDFIASLAQPAFLPLPSSAFGETKNFKNNPVTSGPYRISQWAHSQYVTVVPFTGYRGGKKVTNEGIKFHLYEKTEKPFEDFQSGDLDVLDMIPASEFAEYQKQAENRLVHQPGAAIISLSIHSQTPHFTGEEGRLRRQALSLALDREALADDVLDYSHIAASRFTPPIVAGDTTLEAPAHYDPEQAKQLWREADAISPFTGSIPVHFSHDIAANHQWGKAVARQITKVLGVPADPVPGADFTRFRYDYQTVRFDGLYRTGWVADYPSMREYLVPNFATNGVSNDTQYSNPDVDALFDAASSAENQAEASQLYTDAENILLAELPAIPLLYPAVNLGWNKSVDNVQVGFNSFPLYHSITKDSASCDAS